jgi:hypothetical protein
MKPQYLFLPPHRTINEDSKEKKKHLTTDQYKKMHRRFCHRLASVAMAYKQYLGISSASS